MLQKQMYEGGGNKKQKWKKQTRPEKLSLAPNIGHFQEIEQEIMESVHLKRNMACCLHVRQ